MKFENVIDEIGQCGLAQKIIVSKLFICTAIHVLFMYCYIVHMTVPQYRCVADNVTGMNASSNYFDKTKEPTCNHYTNVSNTTEPCHKWIYDQTEFTSTFASEMDMVCSNGYQRSVIEMSTQAGRMFSGLFIMPFADRFGRKIFITSGLILSTIAALVVAFCQNFFQLTVLSVIVGVACVPLTLCTVAIGVELVGARKRILIAVIQHFAWPITIIFQAFISYFIRDSRTFQLAILVPAILLLPIGMTIPESARWLILKGKEEEAWTILEWAAKKNGVKLQKTELFCAKKSTKTESMLDVLKSPILRFRLIVASIIYFSNNMAYYLTYIESANMFGNVRNSMIGGSVFELITVSVTYMCLRYFGRKSVVKFGLFLGGLSCCAYSLTFVLPFITADNMLLLVMILAKCFFCTCATVVWMYLPEMFPTSCRSAVTGLTAACAYFGSCVTPYVCNMSIFSNDTMNKATSLGIVGFMTILSALLTLFLPETKNKKLCETIEEAELLDHTYDKEINTLEITVPKPYLEKTSSICK